MAAPKPVVVLVGDSDFHFSDTSLPSFLERMLSLCIRTFFHRPSTADLVEKELQRQSTAGAEVYKVGYGSLLWNSYYNKLNLASLLKAVRQNSETVHVTIVISLGQNDCFGTRVSQEILRNRIAMETHEFARILRPYVNRVVVSFTIRREAKRRSGLLGYRVRRTRVDS